MPGAAAPGELPGEYVLHHKSEFSEFWLALELG